MMKTPREILFARQRAAGPKLDALRRTVVASIGHKAEKPGLRPDAGSIWQTLWREIVLPSRAIWSGLAAVWFLLAAFHFSQPQATTRTLSVAGSTIANIREQQKILSEIYADRTPAADVEPQKKYSPSPRTETMPTSFV